MTDELARWHIKASLREAIRLHMTHFPNEDKTYILNALFEAERRIHEGAPISPEITSALEHQKPAFVPTHKLKHDIPQLNLKAGTPVRQINPLADDPYGLKCLEEGDRTPWILTSYDLDELPEWPAIRQEMITTLCTQKENTQ